VTAQTSMAETMPINSQRRSSVLEQIALVTWQSLLTIFRRPAALIPPIAISLFFLVIYNSTLGGAAAFIPDLGANSYLGFILPLSIVSASLSGAGIASQNLVRNIENGYFDKLLLTPISRSALLTGTIFSGALILGLQTILVLGVAVLMGLRIETGFLGILAVTAISVLLGMGFAGFTMSAALGSGSAAVTQSASFVFFPLTFLAPTFVPLALLSGWLRVAAQLNPITYVLEAMRAIINVGWVWPDILSGVLACLILGAAMYLLTFYALRRRTKRS
jgi:ABC-2 type transport system permease protein